MSDQSLKWKLMKEIQISDELDEKLRELAARITALTGKETTTADALKLVTALLHAVCEIGELSPENLQKYQKIAEGNKDLAQETLEMLLSGLIRDYNDFLDSKQNPQDPNQTNI
jgi:enoyl-CoA hydratase/carnithine racemase